MRKNYNMMNLNITSRVLIILIITHLSVQEFFDLENRKIRINLTSYENVSQIDRILNLRQSNLGSFSSQGSFQSGSFRLEWSDSTYYTKFTFSVKVIRRDKRELYVPGSPNQYIAFGFSKDKKMGDDEVIICQVSGHVGVIEHFYNSGKKRPNYLVQDNPTIGISGVYIKMDDGRLFCSFYRDKSVVGTPNYFDLNNQYYLLMVKGSVNAGLIQFHEKNIVISDTLIDFKSNNVYLGKTKTNDKAKAHSCLMVIAWMCFASTGILFARYYKFIFPSVKLLNVAFWFNIHRSLMAFVLICSIASFLVILSDLNWKWVKSDEKLEFSHSIFGILTICLSFIQVMMGIFRPNLESSKRKIFTFSHRLVGLACFSFSKKMNLESNGWGIMIGWTLWVIILPTMIELFVLVNWKKPQNYTKPKDKKIEKKIELFKSIVLVLHLVVSFSLTIALVILIGIGGPKKEQDE